MDEARDCVLLALSSSMLSSQLLLKGLDMWMKHSAWSRATPPLRKDHAAGDEGLYSADCGVTIVIGGGGFRAIPALFEARASYISIST